MYLDEIRYFTTVTEPTTAPVPASSIANYACVCGNCPGTSPPLVTAGPAPPPSPSSGSPAAAGTVAGTAAATGTGSTTTGNARAAKGGSKVGIIAGAVVGVIVVALVAGALAFYFLYWRPHHSGSSSAAYE